MVAIKLPSEGVPSDFRRATEREIFNAGYRKRFVLADLPDPATYHRDIIVTDATGGPCPAWSDGAVWRRLSNDAVVS